MKSKDRSIEEMDRERREAEIIEQNLKKILEEEVNQKALKIGRKVLDEIYLHDTDKITVFVRKSSLFDWDIVEVDVHSITGLFENEVKFIREGNLKENVPNFILKSVEKDTV